MQIRAISNEDRESWNPLWQGYLSFYNTPLPEDVTDSTWHRIVTQDKGFFALVAEDDEGKLIGFAHCLAHYNTWGVAPKIYLEDLYVSQSVRGGGVGRSLIEAVYQEADVRGARDVYWFTNHDNETARRLYDRIGKLSSFVRYDRA
ncbi:MAG: GNAT family N-acetyltransferase [Hyphomicrobiales bacterium]|uniref:GNAT family N-acetyltransferase n=1 Tax=Nisaea sp. TaxID=2024842 RepID=UPI00328F9EDF